MDELPTAVREDFEEYGNIRHKTGVMRLDGISIEQWFQEHKLLTIDSSVVLADLKDKLQETESELAAVVKDTQDISR